MAGILRIMRWFPAYTGVLRAVLVGARRLFGTAFKTYAFMSFLHHTLNLVVSGEDKQLPEVYPHMGTIRVFTMILKSATLPKICLMSLF